MINGIEPKVGQVWKTRDGSSARIINIDTCAIYPISCEFIGYGLRFDVTASGRFLNSEKQMRGDLIELVEDVATPAPDPKPESKPEVDWDY